MIFITNLFWAEYGLMVSDTHAPEDKNHDWVVLYLEEHRVQRFLWFFRQAISKKFVPPYYKILNRAERLYGAK